jgi:DNA primase
MEYTTPGLLLFDIDPEPPLTFDDVIEVAHIVKGYLEATGIQPYVKTSGRKGVHIVITLVPGYRFEEVRLFAHDRKKEIAKETSHVVAEFPRSQEPGTIFIDYLKNANGKTMAAPIRSPGHGKGAGPSGAGALPWDLSMYRCGHDKREIVLLPAASPEQWAAAPV